MFDSSSTQERSVGTDIGGGSTKEELWSSDEKPWRRLKGVLREVVTLLPARLVNITHGTGVGELWPDQLVYYRAFLMYCPHLGES